MMDSYIANAPVLFFATSDDGLLLEVNDYLCKCLNYSRENLAGKSLDSIYTVPTRIFQQTHLFPLLRMQGAASEIFISLKKSGGEELPVLLNAERKDMDGRNLYLYCGIIVQMRKSFEEELVAAKKKAEAALDENTLLIQTKKLLQNHTEELDRQISLVKKQNEELRQLNHVVTHDMEEPLRKLSMFTGMFLEGEGKLDRQTLLRKIQRVMVQMKDNLSGLQQYMWLSEAPVRLTLMDPSNLLHHVKQQLQQEYPEVEFTVHFNSLICFQADVDQMRLLFYELLSNAIRFRKEKSKAVANISTDILQLNQFKNVGEKYKYVDHLRIQIRDQGIGLDNKHQQEALKLFKRLHPTGGRGIGLALCKRIMDNHNGTIKIDGAPHEGVTVSLIIPINPNLIVEESRASNHQTL